jgi:glycine cleavage system H lipoate-binding protein
MPHDPYFWTAPVASDPRRLRFGVTQDWIENLAPDRPLEIVGLDLLPVGARLRTGDGLGILHLPDRAVDLRAPFPLTILLRNGDALADPRLLAESPTARGWLIEIQRT